MTPMMKLLTARFSTSVTKISESDLGTTVNLDLPETNTDALKGNYKYFIFADTFVSATVAQVSAINVVEETSGGGYGGGATTTTYTDVYEFDYATLQDITAQVTSYDRGDRAGVPDEATAEAYGWDYEDDIVAYFGPESDGPWVADNGKIDANGDRKRMADIQYQYDADLTEIDDV